MTAQPLPRETSIELIPDHPVRQARSKTATQTTAKKATAKTTSRSTVAKTAAKTAKTRQRSATKSVAIVESSLHSTVQPVPPNDTVITDALLTNLQHCQQFFRNTILAESDKLTQSMEKLASIALQIQQLQRPNFEPIPVMKTAQRPSRTSVSRLTVRKPIPSYDPSGHRSIKPSGSPAVAPNYWGGNVQAPVTASTAASASASTVAKASPMRHDRLDLPSLPDRPAQPVLHRLAQQQPHRTLAVQPTRPSDSPIQSYSQSHSFTRTAIYRDIYRHIQRLIPIPTEPRAIVVDAVLWTVSSVSLHVIFQVCIQIVPLLSFPLHLVMLFPALFAAYLAFCVPQSSTPSVYRCLLTTLGFFFGSKL